MSCKNRTSYIGKGKEEKSNRIKISVYVAWWEDKKTRL